MPIFKHIGGCNVKFLIVDDSSAIRAIVRRVLLKGGFEDAEFRMAGDGQDALDVMKEWSPDMVITDWHMPGMNGLEMLTQLRRRANDVRVGFVTTELSNVRLEEAFSLGAQFFLHKPFEDSELVSAVCDALEQTLPGEKKPEAPLMELAETALKEINVTLVSTNPVANLINTLFEKRLQAEECPPNANGDISLPAAVSVYVLAGSAEVRGLCLLDQTAMMLVGSAMAGAPIHEVSRALNATEAPKAVCRQTMSVLEGDFTRLFKSNDNRKLSLAKTQIVKQNPAQLQQFIRCSPHRQDFMLARKGLPPGRMTLVAK
jgi:CheY-like chemotaxis protein